MMAKQLVLVNIGVLRELRRPDSVSLSLAARSYRTNATADRHRASNIRHVKTSTIRPVIVGPSCTCDGPEINAGRFVRQGLRRRIRGNIEPALHGRTGAHG